ncbi:MAG: GNAT family N-acetyltransferase [Nitrosomonadales bacterium]|nr:GNAT family N-acetyltransferase [Nitrosomonadales bacterium]
MDIEPITDIENVKTLLAECGLPVADIAHSKLPLFFGIRAESGMVAVVGLELFGSAALLRSLAVSPAYRSHGLARRLVEHAEHVAASVGVDTLFLLTTTASAFFARLGYMPLSRLEAPPVIKATAQFSTLCSESSELLLKEIRR